MKDTTFVTNFISLINTIMMVLYVLKMMLSLSYLNPQKCATKSNRNGNTSPSEEDCLVKLWTLPPLLLILAPIQTPHTMMLYVLSYPATHGNDIFSAGNMNPVNAASM